MKYLGLIRLQDQYIQFGVSIASGLYLGIKDWWILWWAIATTFLSFSAFIVNELTDREDSDKYSTSHIHIKHSTKYDSRIVRVLFWGFTITGLVITNFLGLLWWGIAMWLWAVLYSFKPIRFKARFGLDIIAQLTAWWLIPFLGPVWLLGKTSQVVFSVICLACINWSVFYPYELADFSADNKAKLKGTHVVLGLKNSLLFGMTLGIVGLVLYIFLEIYRSMPWTIPLVLLSGIVIFLYVRWLGMGSQRTQEKSMRNTILWVKPFTQLVVPCLFIWWILG